MQDGLDRGKSLQELERHDWGEPRFDSYLVTNCHRLRRKPLSEFTVEDLRIMIGQAISLPILIPLAIERLEVEPLAQGDLFDGDLLAAVLRMDDSFWDSHPDSRQRIRQVADRAQGVIVASWRSGL